MSKLDRAITGFLREALLDTLDQETADRVAHQLAPSVHKGLEAAASYAHHVPHDPVAEAIWNGIREFGAAVGRTGSNR